MYEAYKGEPFYEHLIHINQIYVLMQREEKYYTNQRQEKENEIFGLKSGSIFDWQGVMQDLSFVNNQFDLLTEFDSQVVINFFAKCAKHGLLANRFQGFSFQDILPENPLHFPFLKLPVTFPTFQPLHMTQETKPDLILRIFYPKQYELYREQIPVKNRLFGFLHDHLNYPNFINMGTQTCVKCEELLKSLAPHFISVYMVKSNSRTVSPYQYLIDSQANSEREDYLHQQKKEESRIREVMNSWTSTQGIRDTDMNRLVEQMAERGDVRAINQLAQDRYFGNIPEGIEPDRQEAMRNYQRAADLGDANAQANLGIIKFQTAVSKDELKEAIDILEKSAEKGITASQNALAWAYETG